MNEEETFITIRKASEFTGLSNQTLRKYADENKIKTYRTPSGQRMFNKQSLFGFVGSVSNNQEKEKIVYCRVSSRKQSDDLERQVRFMLEKYPDHKFVTDCGSGLNFKRKGLQTILERVMSRNVEEIVVAHKDRLCRFGFELIEFICRKYGTKIIILQDDGHSSSEQELAEDILSIITIFSCRQMGKRKYRIKDNKSETLSNLQSENNH